MARTVSIGTQDFEEIVSQNCFYVDKTGFIKEWWESYDKVTLITRPRRFGKTLNMNMLERFFSVKFEGQGEVFEGLDIWREEKYRELQGTYPVIFLSFANVKANDYDGAVYQICELIMMLYREHYYLAESNILEEEEKKEFRKMTGKVSQQDVPMAINKLSSYLHHHYGKKVIILLDEYDTPMQEAYVYGYWNELVSMTRLLFNSTFKTNSYLERAVMTGITRVSKESLFSDLNNLKVLTITSNKYAPYFGFTEEEVFAAMDEFGMTNKDEVKQWYDGFTIGKLTDIYNPWSIINLLDEGKLKAYWANTSSNGLVSSLIKEGDKDIKMQFELLMSGKTIFSRIDEEMVFNRLDDSEEAVWSLMVAAGYLKIVGDCGRQYELKLTNYEVKLTFEDMVHDWFGRGRSNYNGFIKALLSADIEAMNEYMNEVAESMFSSFDGGKKPSAKTTPERFYHGFVLGLLVDLADRYEVKSNRESGFGRYDVMLNPLNKKDDGIINNGIKNDAITNNYGDAITNNRNDAIIMEFKIYNPKKESSLEETVQAALNQIEEKRYEQELLNHGIKKENIRKYGFAFEGKNVLVGEG